MELQQTPLDGSLRLAVVGSLTADCAAEFKRAVAEIAAGHPRIVLDLGAMHYLDSAGLGALVFAMQTASERGGELKIAALADKPRIIFDITRAHKIFNVYDTVEEARAAFVSAEPR